MTDYPDDSSEEYTSDASHAYRTSLERAREDLIALLDAESLKVCFKLLAVLEAGREAEQNAEKDATESEALNSQVGKCRGKGHATKRGTRNQNPGRKNFRGNRNLPTITEDPEC